MRTANRNREPSIINYQLSIAGFLRDEGGQGIIFAAATLLLLVGFVALVYNIGRVVDRRTKMQLGADSAVYAGAVVEGNSISAIGWINSAMAQVYYNALKYAVNVNVSGVAAELESQETGGVHGTAFSAYQNAYNEAKTYLPEAKQWLANLSRIENAVAILTPRLMEEEMYAVAGEVGAERVSVYPSFRMFPHGDRTISFSIQRLPNGWVITNIAGGNGDSVSVTLNGDTWDIQYTHNGMISQDVQITQVNPNQWDIKYYQPPGTLVQEIGIVNTNGLGWTVWGSSGSPPNPIPMFQFSSVPVVTPEGVTVNGTMVSSGGTTEVLWMGADGNLYSCNWNSSTNSWNVALPPLTGSQTTIAGVNVNVNVTNQINFPGASATIGNPTTVNIGNAHIVLSNPPSITTGLGPVQITINGFTPNSFSASVGGFSLTPGDSDGAWRKYYNPIEELWWRNRLVVMGLDGNNQPDLWEYDYETLGALLQQEASIDPLANITNSAPGQFVVNSGAVPDRFLTWHVFGDRGASPNPLVSSAGSPWNSLPAWVQWFNPKPSAAAPRNISTSGSVILPYLLSQTPLPTNLAGVYYQAGLDQNNNLICVTIADLIADQSLWQSAGAPSGNPMGGNVLADYCLSAPMFIPTQKSVLYTDPNPDSFGQLPKALPPLVLSQDFFKYGVNVGIWKSPINPLLFPTPGSALNTQNAPFIFPTSTTPAPNTDTLAPTAQWWGTMAISSARVGVEDPNDTTGNAEGGYLFNFNGMAGYDSQDSSSPRGVWCANNPANLYYAGVSVKLLPSKELPSDEQDSQVQSCDLDWGILQGAPVNPINESPTTYLWGALLGASQTWPFQNNDWLNGFNGRADPRVGNALRNMQNRQGNIFGYDNTGLDADVEH